MNRKIQIIENYFIEYNFKIEKRILTKEDFCVDINVNYKIQNKLPKESIYKEVILKNEIILKNNSTEETLGKINATIYGLFEFEKNISYENIKFLLKTEGVPMLYWQLKAYISANTALSQAIPTINLPNINFKIREDI